MNKHYKLTSLIAGQIDLKRSDRKKHLTFKKEGDSHILTSEGEYKMYEKGIKSLLASKWVKLDIMDATKAMKTMDDGSAYAEKERLEAEEAKRKAAKEEEEARLAKEKAEKEEAEAKTAEYLKELKKSYNAKVKEYKELPKESKEEKKALKKEIDALKEEIKELDQ